MSAILISQHPINDPEHPPNEAEARVAELLTALGDGFVIRWGFDSADESGMVQGEGDFLILGPDGNVLHLEVKGGPVTFNPSTRRFATADGSHPLEQRDRVWSQVVRRLNAHAHQTGRKGPYVQRRLALPDVTISRAVTAYQTMPREALLDSEDLKEIGRWWPEHFREQGHPDERRQVFLELFDPARGVATTSRSLDFAERIIERQTCAAFPLLDAVEQNRQLLFCGGPGTGKTWFALELARRWATAGHHVLILTYNLELAWVLGEIARRHDSVRLTVRSYEGLAADLLAGAGREFSTPERSDRATAARVYDVEIPRALREIAETLPDSARYDALVVDEAQDHNTSYPPEVGAPDSAPGWWEIYTRLLREGPSARVAVFYDRRQRHFARGGEFFDPHRLEELFPRLIRVRLRQTMRYTRQLREFFQSLGDLPGTEELLRDMDTANGSPEGPPPVVLQAASNQEEKSAAGRIARDWCENRGCRPEDLLILYPTSAARPQWLNNPKLNGITLAKGHSPGLQSFSVHKAKGLEAKGVILLGFPPVAVLKSGEAPTGAAFTWLMGATRARQLLAIVERTDFQPEDVRVS